MILKKNNIGLYLLFVLIVPFLATSCKLNNRAKDSFHCPISSFKCLKGTSLVVISTSKGRITIELDGKNAPVTSGNFLDLIKKDVYTKTKFHRVIKEPNPFIIQGGDPLTKDSTTYKKDYGTGSYMNLETGQTRYIPLEFKLKGEKYPRYGKEINDPKEMNRIALKHVKGAIAMARGQSPNSASSQFYITLKTLTELDGRYTVFGKVVKGMDVVYLINEGDRIINTYVEK